MRKLFHYLPPRTERMITRLCSLLLVFCCHQAVADIQPLSSSTQKDEQVKQIVLGIMSYTRWVPPPSPVQLCIVGAARYSASLEHLEISTPNKIIINKQNEPNPELSTQCDVIYFGDVKPDEQQKMIAARQNHPILVLSENNPSCEIGGSFCLDTETSPITFVVNLDSLARSGVHVNPNVLLLGKKRAVQ